MPTNQSERTRRILADPSKRPGWIIYELGLRGRNLAQIGRELGVGRTTIYRVWEIRYPKMQAAIAKELGMRPQDLFPERYDEDGIPRKFRGGGKPPPDGKNTTRQKRINVRRETKNNHRSETQAA